MEPNYANVVRKIIKWYMNCGITAVVMDIILSIMGQVLLISIIGKKLGIIGWCLTGITH